MYDDQESDTLTDDEDHNYSTSEQAWEIIQRQISEILGAAVSAVTQATGLATQREEASPYYTSILTGAGWVKELLNGHPERIRNELGVHKHVFRVLVTELQNAGYTHSTHVKIEEQLAIFLYMCVTGLTLPHVAERFQRSKATISENFEKILFAFSSPQIYSKYVQLPRADDPTPDVIRKVRRFMPYFKDAIGAMDGTHIPCIASAEEWDDFTYLNCLVCCNFDMKFTYVLSGWEGSATDTTGYHDARISDLAIPPNKYYLADAGFPSCTGLLVPYPGERYNLAEWGHAQPSPANQREYFNLRHAQLRNVVERIIDVLQRRFRILMFPPEFSMEVQTRILSACCCIHNIIRTFDEAELEDMEPGDEDVAHPLDA